MKKILVLTHSTGKNLYEQGNVPGWFDDYNTNKNKDYQIERLDFPTAKFYGWKNYPYDYWNIWVNHNGYRMKPSLGRLARNHDLIVWKHCYPGSRIESDPLHPTVSDEIKSIAAYKLQYNDLKNAMHYYPETKFLIWTLAVMREDDLTEDQAKRTKEFVEWVKFDWDEPGDNIYVWDFYSHETTSADGNEQSLYLRPEYATNDSHPNDAFNKRVAPYFCEKIINALHGDE